MIQDLARVLRSIERNWQDRIHVLVVGDVMLDQYLWGEVERISPEAPVPVVKARRRSEHPGGAANVAMNVAGLGGRATLVGLAGGDGEQAALEAMLRSAGVKPQLVAASGGAPTVTKLRIFSGSQQMLRLDREQESSYSAEDYRLLRTNALAAVATADVLVLSDYAKGTLTEAGCAALIEQARRRAIPVLVDPKTRNLAKYRSATTICPNLRELALATGEVSRDPEVLLTLGQRLVPELGLDYLIVTMSECGMALLGPERRIVAPAVARQVFDVSGAGDTVMAVLALCAASGIEGEAALQLANTAAGIVVGKLGTVPVQRRELLAALAAEIAPGADDKILPLESLAHRVALWRATGQRIVFTNGCYDLLHAGHLTLLEQAKRQGDRLLVAINSDRSVRGLKGPSRPLIAERQRAQLLAALSVVDAVVVFDDPTPLRLIETLHPDVIVKGGDYADKAVVGAQEVLAWGGEVKLVDLVHGLSTTELIARATSGVN